jgi:hypothetical protein
MRGHIPINIDGEPVQVQLPFSRHEQPDARC